MKTIYLLNFIKSIKNLPQSVKEKKIEDKKILVVSPHSDDISISCGATIYSLSKKNKIFPVLFFTGAKEKKMIKKREKEMKKESKVLKTENPTFLRLSSYHRDDPESFKKDILLVKEFFRKYRPDIIFLPKRDDFHPRHKLATKIALESLPASDPSLIFYESPWSLFGSMEFNMVSVFNKKVLKKKLKAIKRHSSQIKRTPLDKIARNLAEIRGLVVPEQIIKGYGEETEEFKECFMESFVYQESNKNYENNN